MNHGDAGGIEEIESKIAVGGNVHAVEGDGIELKVAGDSVAVERKTAAGQRSGAER